MRNDYVDFSALLCCVPTEETRILVLSQPTIGTKLLWDLCPLGC